MIRTALALTLALLVVPACGGKKEEGGGAAKTGEAKAPAGDKAADKAPEAPAAAAAPEMDSVALYEDYNKPGQDGLALMKKWENGVTVSGTVTQVISEESGKTTLWLSGGEKKRVSVDFKDEGKVAKEKGIKKDDKITAKCSIGGADGTSLMMLTDCELK